MAVSPEVILKSIAVAKRVYELSPPMINAASHIVQNGIRQGGYDVMAAAWKGIVNGGSYTSLSEVGTSAFQGIQGTFQGSGSFVTDLTNLGGNIRTRFIAPQAAPTVPKLGTADAFKATDALNHAVTESASGISSVLGSVGSAAAKGGAAGIVLGITMETLASHEKYKNGEITKEEYAMEVAKSGAQMGITGAATSGIVTALSVPLAAAGLASAPITVPISIIIGAGIDKIIAPAFGRGDYAKILGEAKYYQNLMYAHDDLVHAIEMTERQFADFIDEYARQMQVHAELTDYNRQLSGLHKVADQQISAQSAQLSDTFSSLGNLYDKI